MSGNTESPDNTAAPFTFTNRKPKGTPVGGQFSASERAESDVSLIDYGNDDWTIGGALAVGQWAEGENTRIRLVPEDARDSSHDAEQTLVLDVQVREDHPDAGEPTQDSPGWAKPRSTPLQRPRVPQASAVSPDGRGRFAAFALRRFDSLSTDFSLAWGELGEAFDMSIPQIR